MKLFALDSPFMEGMRKLADVIIINLLFIVCSIPLITMGASFAAMTECVQILADDTDNGLIFLDFFRSFIRNFKKATLLELILGAVAAGLWEYRKAISLMEGGLARSYTITWFVMIILVVFFIQFLFPTLVYKKRSVKETIRDAVVLSVVKFPLTLLSILVLVFAGVLSYMIYYQSGYTVAFIWMVAGFGLVAYFNQIIYGWAAGIDRSEER